jgi:hypothetical protein
MKTLADKLKQELTALAFKHIEEARAEIGFKDEDDEIPDPGGILPLVELYAEIDLDQVAEKLAFGIEDWKKCTVENYM